MNDVILPIIAIGVVFVAWIAFIIWCGDQSVKNKDK